MRYQLFYLNLFHSKKIWYNILIKIYHNYFLFDDNWLLKIVQHILDEMLLFSSVGFESPLINLRLINIYIQHEISLISSVIKYRYFSSSNYFLFHKQKTILLQVTEYFYLSLIIITFCISYCKKCERREKKRCKFFHSFIS